MALPWACAATVPTLDPVFFTRLHCAAIAKASGCGAKDLGRGMVARIGFALFMRLRLRRSKERVDQALAVGSSTGMAQVTIAI